MTTATTQSDRSESKKTTLVSDALRRHGEDKNIRNNKVK